ncbi:hypothetical protein [Ferrimonas pelagia]|uniref:Uncharacterized protein n=1 Tax=Ferrimonas pelagia TaxID=1177826 RepID=A0ABP9EPC7_9GAMM
MWKKLGLGLLLVLALPVAVLAVLLLRSEPMDLPALPTQPGQGKVVGAAVAAKPLPDLVLPQHPFMAQTGFNAMHADPYNSDVHRPQGPLGHAPVVQTRQGRGGDKGMCVGLTFRRDGLAFMLCSAMQGFQFQLVDPETLTILARHDLPSRPSTWQAIAHRDLGIIYQDSSGGAYYYLDHQDRVVLVDPQQRLLRLAAVPGAEGWQIVEERAWDLSAAVPNRCFSLSNWNPTPEQCDPVTAALPDMDGVIWWITRYGRIGTLDPETGAIRVIHLAGEEIQNSFAVAEDGVFIVSDHALYRFDKTADGTPQVDWRERYDRGSGHKVGAINQGSGTTPTLLGTDYITVTDNADDRINLLVYQRASDWQGEREICRIPLFESGHSVTDNSMIGYGNSIIIENNYGYRYAMAPPTEQAVTGGISRIDVRPDGSGCDRIWHSTERAPSVVPKLSLGSGLAYFYTFDTQADGENAWYLMALDFETGETAFKIHTGVGERFDNSWAPITIGPDGTLYVGVFAGIVAIKDGERL